MIEGGLSGWHLANGRIFPGWNVIGKAFGDYIEKTRGTPTIDAAELKALIDSASPPIILDTRTLQEHNDYCIPGALHCPNGETLLRAPAAITDPDRLIVTHCAGRTRGIMGAQTLIECGIPNRVVSLGNGTLEWALAGYALEHGANRPLPIPHESDMALARSGADALRNRYHVRAIGKDELRERQGEARTVIVLDVRTPQEIEAGTLPGACAAPGVQLLQGMGQMLAVRNARYVLLDTDGVRSARMGAWMKQMGYRNVETYAADPQELVFIRPPATEQVDMPLADIRAAMDRDELVIADVRGGVAYRRAHVRGSWFLGRANLKSDLQRLPEDKPVVLLSDEIGFARLLDRDLSQLGRQTHIVTTPLQGWEQAGFDLEQGAGQMASEPHDAIYDLEEREIHVRDAHDYLKWRVNLFEILAGDPGATYVGNA